MVDNKLVQCHVGPIVVVHLRLEDVHIAEFISPGIETHMQLQFDYASKDSRLKVIDMPFNFSEANLSDRTRATTKFRNSLSNRLRPSIR
jgi:hypothetical protein